MRFSLLILTAIMLSSILAIGSAVTPYHADALNLSQKENGPRVTNATITNDQDTPSFGPFQASYLSLSLTTDKAVYLTGETVNITVSTSTINTHVRLLAQLPDGSQQTIENFTLNYTHMVSWTAPATPGQIRFICNGEALTEVWDYCTRYVCIGDPPDCYWDNYPCLRSIAITGSTSNDIRVFGRTTSISGRI